jgi:hypothetical protein
MIADRTGWRGSRRASFSALLRARYRLAASALRVARGTGLAGRPRPLRGGAFVSSSPTRFIAGRMAGPVPLTDPFARLLIVWRLCRFRGLLSVTHHIS